MALENLKKFAPKKKLKWRPWLYYIILILNSNELNYTKTGVLKLRMWQSSIYVHNPPPPNFRHGESQRYFQNSIWEYFILFNINQQFGQVEYFLEKFEDEKRKMELKTDEGCCREVQAVIQEFCPGGVARVGWTQGGCLQISIPAYHSYRVWERCKLPSGSGAEPQLPTILVNFSLKSKHLVLYKSLFHENCSIIFKNKKFMIIANGIILFLVRSGTQPGSPSN